MPEATTTATPEPETRLVSPATFARMMGISRSHTYSLLERGLIRSIHLGRSRRIPLSEVERIVREGVAE